MKLVESVKGAGRPERLYAGPAGIGVAAAQGNDVVPIPGTKHRSYLCDNVAATDVRLTSAELAELCPAGATG